MTLHNTMETSPRSEADALILHALSVSNGILALCRLPGATGAYSEDLQTIGEWKPGLVLSMTTQNEQAAVGAYRLGMDLQSMACRWIHLPVPDYSVPSAEVMANWPAASQAVRQALAGGGRVLVHCKGGSGRSGMAVLRLMIEGGEQPRSALERLRLVRPSAVETDEQLAWAISAGRM